MANSFESLNYNLHFSHLNLSMYSISRISWFLSFLGSSFTVILSQRSFSPAIELFSVDENELFGELKIPGVP